MKSVIRKMNKLKEECKKYVLDKSQSGAYDLAGSIEEETEDLYNFINQNYVPKVEFKQISNPLEEEKYESDKRY